MVAAAIGCSAKELANIINRIGLRAGTDGLQGRSRRIDVDSVRALDIVSQLSRSGLSATAAYTIARMLERDHRAEIGGVIVLTYDRAGHIASLNQRLSDAAQKIVPRRRGRPPKK